MNLLKAEQTLELKKGYSENDIKQNYRRLVMKYHPDKCKDPNSEECFIKIQKAYEFFNNKKEVPNDIDLFNTINHIFKNLPFQLQKAK